ncbi:MAG TPA: hypothetical protein VHL98_08390 [Microvirga sp.]|jgi:hypothetical protein|nr:hypothetical protein [Microvirga sp.]
MSTLKLMVCAAGLAALGAGLAPDASAQSSGSCGARDKILSALSNDYKEAPVGIGLTQTGSVIELLVSEKGSWTLLATGPSGSSCMIAAGQNWESMTLPVGNKT